MEQSNYSQDVINESYQKFLVANSLEKLALSNKNSYEFRNVLERYLMTAYPHQYSIKAFENLEKEMKKKRIEPRVVLIKKITTIINSKPSIGKPILEIREEKYKVIMYYGEFVFEIPKLRYQLLRTFGDDYDILQCALEYKSLLPSSQQWAIPLKEYQKYVAEGATIEGFASPFNSQIIVVDRRLHYCSLFEHDKKFGSLGNFFDQDFAGQTVIVNPPFVESILQAAAEKCDRELATHPCKFVFYGPEWNDSPFYQILRKSAFLIKEEVLVAGSYHYEDLLTNKPIKANYNSVIFTLAAEAND